MQLGYSVTVLMMILAVFCLFSMSICQVVYSTLNPAV